MGVNERFYTAVSHDAHDDRHFGSISVPVYQSSLFSFDTYEDYQTAMQDEQNSVVYSRGNNPTVRYLEDKLAELEGGERAKCFASGMAAISAAILSVVRQGDHIVCTHQAYGPTRQFLSGYLAAKFGIETTFVDGRSVDEWAQAVRPNTRLLYLESPTSGLFELQPIRACAELAASIGAETIVDNSWATPMFQNPLKLGVGLVVHSLTKYISGHSDCLGGVVIGSRRLMDPLMASEYMLLGGVMSPQAAAMIIRGLRTLPLRMARHEASGLRIAEHMSRQPWVMRVNHPGLPSHPQHELARAQMSGSGSLFSFESKVPVAKLRLWADRLRYFRIGPSWGGFESLVTVNGMTRPGGEPLTLVRLYIGTEDPADLIRDLDDAWQSVAE